MNTAKRYISFLFAFIIILNAVLLTPVSASEYKISFSEFNDNEAEHYTNNKTGNDVLLSEQSEALIGDVDGDREITINDATYIRRDLVNIKIPFELDIATADIDGDRAITLIDATEIQRILLSLTPLKTKGYEGAKVSILGASISTFEGYIPNDYTVYYPHKTSNPDPVLDVHDTYWMRFIDIISGELLVNNSSSGSFCSTGHGEEIDAKAGCGIRCEALDNGTDMPDIIIIQLGGNDFTRSTPLGTYNGTQEFPTDTDTFREAYAVMLSKITSKYKDAKVICGTIPIISGGEYVTRTFPVKNLYQSESRPGGILLDDYNQAIRELAGLYNCQIADFSNCGLTFENIPTYMQDYYSKRRYGQHPNRSGHSMMTIELLKALRKTNAIFNLK